ncbi:uncharacterized protein LOC114732246 [Neltuma alba]|uniref:uncharacterized protein LOC114732246 n=1 Tax=Neltuma alba TaxID=207710 RepID=UPI0010A3BAE8|nr:uncharacterized protein LOC114732246 [Prosopis alba]
MCNKGTMAKNGKVIAFTGYAKVVPSKGPTSNQSKHSQKSHTRMSRTDYKDNKVSNRCIETRKSGDYVTKSKSVGYKQEARTTSTVKVTAKGQGITIEHQTQVKVKKVVYQTTAKSSSSKRINYY